MTFVSYAQNFEDVLLWRALKTIENGFYLDVGAHDPRNGSVTKAFYERGWTGINFEPTDIPFNKLVQERPRDTNLQICLGDYDGVVELYDVTPSGLATAKKSIAEQYIQDGYSVAVNKMPIRRLESICNDYEVQTVHFLKIDVEGLEKEVLAGGNFSLYRPWIVVVEATHPNTPLHIHDEWEILLTSQQYTFTYFDGLNRYYLASEHAELTCHFERPPNYFDAFALDKYCFFSREILSEIQSLEAALHLTECANRELEMSVDNYKEKGKNFELEIHNYEKESKRLKLNVRRLEEDANRLNEGAKKTEINIQVIQRLLAIKEKELLDIKNSTSWKFSVPIRLVGNLILIIKVLNSKFLLHLKTNLIIKLSHARLYIIRRPRLKRWIISGLIRMPRIATKLRSLVLKNNASDVLVKSDATRIRNLRPHAKGVYLDIKKKMNRD